MSYLMKEQVWLLILEQPRSKVELAEALGINWKESPINKEYEELGRALNELRFPGSFGPDTNGKKEYAPIVNVAVKRSWLQDGLRSEHYLIYYAAGQERMLVAEGKLSDYYVESGPAASRKLERFW